MRGALLLTCSAWRARRACMLKSSEPQKSRRSGAAEEEEAKARWQRDTCENIWMQCSVVVVDDDD